MNRRDRFNARVNRDIGLGLDGVTRARIDTWIGSRVGWLTRARVNEIIEREFDWLDEPDKARLEAAALGEAYPWEAVKRLVDEEIDIERRELMRSAIQKAKRSLQPTTTGETE